jgi:hypothetical protein
MRATWELVWGRRAGAAVKVESAIEASIGSFSRAGRVHEVARRCNGAEGAQLHAVARERAILGFVFWEPWGSTRTRAKLTISDSTDACRAGAGFPAAGAPIGCCA